MGQGHILDANTVAMWRFDHGPNLWRQRIIDHGQYGTHATASSLTLGALERPYGPNGEPVRQGRSSAQLSAPLTSHAFSANGSVVAALKTSYTVEFFIMPTLLDNSRTVCTIGASNALLFRIDIIGGGGNGRLRLFWEVSGADQAHDQVNGVQMQLNTWYHCAIVKDTPNALVHFYIDGALQDSVAKAAEPNASSAAGCLFNNLNVNLGLHACIKDFTLIPGVKDASAIAARAALLNTTFELPVDPSALFHFRCDESSDIVIDSVGNGSSALAGSIPLLFNEVAEEPHYVPSLIGDGGFAMLFANQSRAGSYGIGDSIYGPAVDNLRQVLQQSAGFTFECWLNLLDIVPYTGTEEGIRGIFCFGDPGQITQNLNFLTCDVLGNGAIRWHSEFNVDADSIRTGTPGVIPMSGTFHLALRRNPTISGSHSVDVFVNGVNVDTITSITPFNGGDAGAQRFYIGYGEYETGSPMYGIMDDIRVSDIPRTDDEIMQSYLRGIGISNVGLSVISPDIGSIIQPSDAIQLLATSEIDTIDNIDVHYSDGSTENAYTASSFTAGFNSGSSLNNNDGDVTIILERNDGWLKTIAYIEVTWTDLAATETTQRAGSWVKGDAGPPTITIISPAAGSVVGPSTRLVFRYEDDNALRRALPTIKIKQPGNPPTYKYELIHDGDNFAPDYIGTRTVIQASGPQIIEFTVQRKGGWAATLPYSGVTSGDAFEMVPFGTDTAGNEPVPA